MGSLLISGAILIWSSWGVLVRLSGAGIYGLIFYSTIVGLIAQTILVLITGRHRNISKKTFFPPLLLLGPLLLLNNSTYFYALKHTTFANAIAVHYIAPVIVAALSPLLLREKAGRKTELAIVLASIGLWVLVGLSPQKFLLALREGDTQTMGIAAAAVSGFAYAFLIMSARKLAKSRDPLLLCTLQSLSIALIMLPFFPVYEPKALHGYLIAGLVHSTLAPLMYLKGISTVRAERAAALGYLEPLGGVLIGMAFFTEHPAAHALLGGALILFSGYLTIKDE